MPATANVLVVDDSALVRRQVGEVVASLGLRTIDAGDGSEALRRLDSDDVALVITDFMMPKMSGIDLIEAVRARPGGADLPIVVISSIGSGSLVQGAWALGVRAWLKKPFKPEMLASTITSILSPQAEGERDDARPHR